MSTFENDAEFLDGKIVERSVGDNSHSEVQGRLVGIFHKRSDEHFLHLRPALRVQTSATRYRVVDFAIFKGPEPTERFPSSPPHIAIEIVSRDDRFTEIVEKLDEYHRWGVPHIWLVDPHSRKLSVYSAAGLSEVSSIELPDLDLRLTFTDLLD